ncbi:DUF6220 domain-containing protein [Paenibacillus sp. SI8]|uniref:DUF6220 domain-containing protein n=1 Tax=unclassified Paenibacillus TaxID=185978 RepID=UPI0034674B8B
MNQQTVRNAHFIFKLLAWIFAISILIQVLLAGLALFGDAIPWSSHASFARYFSILPVLMLAASFIAKSPASLRIQIIALIGMIVLMFVTAIFSSKIGFLSALHPVIAVFLFFRTMAIIRQSGVLIQAK